MGKIFVFCQIKLKFCSWLYKKCWHTSWKFQLEITSNKKLSLKSLWQTYMKWTVDHCIGKDSLSLFIMLFGSLFETLVNCHLINSPINSAITDLIISLVCSQLFLYTSGIPPVTIHYMENSPWWEYWYHHGSENCHVQHGA